MYLALQQASSLGILWWWILGYLWELAYDTDPGSPEDRTSSED